MENYSQALRPNYNIIIFFSGYIRIPTDQWPPCLQVITLWTGMGTLVILCMPHHCILDVCGEETFLFSLTSTFEELCSGLYLHLALIWIRFWAWIDTVIRWNFWGPWRGVRYSFRVERTWIIGGQREGCDRQHLRLSPRLVFMTFSVNRI